MYICITVKVTSFTFNCFNYTFFFDHSFLYFFSSHRRTIENLRFTGFPLSNAYLADFGRFLDRFSTAIFGARALSFPCRVFFFLYFLRTAALVHYHFRQISFDNVRVRAVVDKRHGRELEGRAARLHTGQPHWPFIAPLHSIARLLTRFAAAGSVRTTKNGLSGS
ncbi:hypothetical protein PUN28_019791 [Cardiocondyla obscurior]|uniref:Uncharacterized protein n=1 Tax=Cardiocondyla obscurior TaxID=286306 RepID=A0AAW2E7E9_9HYME